MNGDSAEYTRQVAAVFEQVAAGYDLPALRFFPFIADRLVRRLAPAPGDKILDIATGTGAFALAAAQAVGPAGRVTGIDVAEGMLERAQEKIRKFGIANVDLHVMDGGRLEFRHDYFHHVVCSFGLFFLPDMATAVREWARVLRPGGRVMFTVFGQNAFQPMMGMLQARLATFGVEPPRADQPFAPKRLSEPSACEALLRQAGFVDITVETEPLGYHLREARDWWEIAWNSALRGRLLGLSAQQLEKLREEHLAEVAALATEQGIWLDVETLIAAGRKP
jgi:ubiquinone/menaquinone biosynthesis C-methylase UbiE